jgi:molybdopterin/thiamine biosynthesis adenylyltransferase
LLIGAGGLGSPTALYLAAAGVGTIGLMDADVVDVSNLQRQALHTTADIGKPKVESGARTFTALNPDVNVIRLPERISVDNAMAVVPPPTGLVPSCAEAGVLGVLPGIVSVVQATETVKLLLGIGDPLIGRLLTYDALGMRFREVKLRRDPACPLCGVTPTIKDLSDHPVGDELVCEVPPLR